MNPYQTNSHLSDNIKSKILKSQSLASDSRTVSDLSEHVLLERIRTRIPPDPPWVTIGIGDDAAVIEPSRGSLDVITTDALVEGIHFNFAFTSPEDLGFKALAVNLSDLAAMGATPRWAVISLTLPARMQISSVDVLIGALLELAVQHGVTLIGGNTTCSPGPLIVNITACGTIKRRRILSRSGARPGDELYVSGTIGAAAAGLQHLQKSTLSMSVSKGQPEMSWCKQRFLRPDPRVRLGISVAKNRAASACIDLSDGLAKAVQQLASASGTGAIIDASAVPIDPNAWSWFEQAGIDPLTTGVIGGEDYELLFAVPQKLQRRFHSVCQMDKSLPLTRIGTITSDHSLVLRVDHSDTPLPAGFDHFSGT